MTSERHNILQREHHVMDLHFYSNGKLLLTGEYLILFGAKSLAFPVRYGQSLTISKNNYSNEIIWNAFSPEGLWFEAKFLISNDFKIVETNSMERALYLKKLFKLILKYNPGFEGLKESCIIKTQTDYVLFVKIQIYHIPLN